MNVFILIIYKHLVEKVTKNNVKVYDFNEQQ